MHATLNRMGCACCSHVLPVQAGDYANRTYITDPGDAMVGVDPGQRNLLTVAAETVSRLVV
jgi:hypothetical protein